MFRYIFEEEYKKNILLRTFVIISVYICFSLNFCITGDGYVHLAIIIILLEAWITDFWGDQSSYPIGLASKFVSEEYRRFYYVFFQSLLLIFMAYFFYKFFLTVYMCS